MPRLRAMSMSGLVSELKLTMPSTSAGSDAGILSARSTASTARRNSERPESLENSVAPMPAIATCAGEAVRAHAGPQMLIGQRDDDGAGDMVAQLVGAADGHRDRPALGRPRPAVPCR